MFNLSQEDKERARRLHKESIVVDTLAHALYTGSVFSQNMLKRLDEFSEDVPTRVILAEMAGMETQEIVDGSLKEYKALWDAADVDVASVSVAIPGFEVMTDLSLWTRKFDALDWLVKATSVKDIEQAKKEGKRAVILNFQNDEIGRDLSKLDLFYNFGVRIMCLQLNIKGYVGDGCTERTDCGLSYYGVEVVKRMNELGIIVDLTHVGRKTTLDAIEVSTKPVIYSHTTCAAIYKHDRASTDEELRALAANNGYCGIMIPPFFLAAREDHPSIEHYLNHIEHAIEIAGIDTVGIGTDWGSSPKALHHRWEELLVKEVGFRKEHDIRWGEVTEGWEDWDKWPNITRGLVSRGYSDEEIKGILGGNFLRVFKEVVG